MPLPKPGDGESEKAYIARFMSDENAQSDFPEQQQRLAVAYSYLRKAGFDVSATAEWVGAWHLAGWDESEHPRAGDGKFTSGGGVSEDKPTYTQSGAEWKDTPEHQVAKTILEQLGGNRFRMMTGANKFEVTKTGLAFAIPRSKNGTNRVAVNYNAGKDLYDVDTFRVAGGTTTQTSHEEDLYAEDLQPHFTRITGLDTHLSAGDVTAWHLAEWDESEHPRADDGKFSSAGGVSEDTPAYRSTTDRSAAIRQTLKDKGWSSRDVSVRSEYYSMGSSIHVEIKNPAVPLHVVEKVANEHESIDRDQFGEILGGGNRYVHVGYTAEALTQRAAPILDAVIAAGTKAKADPNDRSLHPVEGTNYLIGRDRGSYSVWQKDKGHIGAAYDAQDAGRLIATQPDYKYEPSKKLSADVEASLDLASRHWDSGKWISGPADHGMSSAERQRLQRTQGEHSYDPSTGRVYGAGGDLLSDGPYSRPDAAMPRDWLMARDETASAMSGDQLADRIKRDQSAISALADILTQQRAGDPRAEGWLQSAEQALQASESAQNDFASSAAATRLEQVEAQAHASFGTKVLPADDGLLPELRAHQWRAAEAKYANWLLGLAKADAEQTGPVATAAGIVHLAEFDESEHPRAADGKFTNAEDAALASSFAERNALADLLARPDRRGGVSNPVAADLIRRVSPVPVKAEDVPVLKQAAAAWTAKRAYMSNGQFHIKAQLPEPDGRFKARGPIAPWNKTVKQYFPIGAGSTAEQNAAADAFHKFANEMTGEPEWQAEIDRPRTLGADPTSLAAQEGELKPSSPEGGGAIQSLPAGVSTRAVAVNPKPLNPIAPAVRLADALGRVWTLGSFEESLHPRDEHGRFTDGGGASTPQGDAKDRVAKAVWGLLKPGEPAAPRNLGELKARLKTHDWEAHDSDEITRTVPAGKEFRALKAGAAKLGTEGQKAFEDALATHGFGAARLLPKSEWTADELATEEMVHQAEQAAEEGRRY